MGQLATCLQFCSLGVSLGYKEGGCVTCIRDILYQERNLNDCGTRKKKGKERMETEERVFYESVLDRAAHSDKLQCLTDL